MSPSSWALQAAPSTSVLSARSKGLLQKHNQTLAFPADHILFLHSTANLENLTIIQTAFSVWAEMETVFILTKLQMHFKFYLAWRLFQYIPKQIKELGELSFPFFPFSFDILYQGLLLLILSASCYLKLTSTEMCVFAGRLHQTFIVQYCDSW